jgi:hypothetical protein
VTALVARARRGLSRWLWRRHGLTWQLPSGLHARVESLSDWVVYNEIFVDRVYDTAIEQALGSVPPDRPLRVLDLGAHVGYFSLRVADLVRLRPGARAAIVMVEAHPDTFEALTARWRVQPRLASCAASRASVRAARAWSRRRSPPPATSPAKRSPAAWALPAWTSTPCSRATT